MKFIFDENLPLDFAKGINNFGEDVEHVLDHFPPGTTDVEILEFIGKNEYFLVTKDKRIRYNQGEIQALRKYKVGAFFLVGKTMRRWDIVKQIINSWENIKGIAERENRPFIYKLRRSGTPQKYDL